MTGAGACQVDAAEPRTAFKAEMALAALTSDTMLSEPAHRYGIHLHQVTDWNWQLTQRAVQVRVDATGPASRDPNLTKLHVRIGPVGAGERFPERGAHHVEPS